MTALSKNLETLTSLYNSLQPEKMKASAPRVGYYFIKSTYPGFIGMPIYKSEKVRKLKDIVAEAKRLSSQGLPISAENKLKEVIPTY